MAFISKKTIHGKTRYYLEESVRLPSGEVKKYSIYLKGYDPKKGPSIEDRQKLREKVESGILDWAESNYQKNSIFDNPTIRKLEAMRLRYKTITKNLTKKQWQAELGSYHGCKKRCIAYVIPHFSCSAGNTCGRECRAWRG